MTKILVNNGKKYCASCKLEKDVSDFYYVSHTHSKLTSHCKICFNFRVKTKKLKDIDAARKVRRERTKKYFSKDPSRKILHSQRTRMTRILKNNKKSESSLTMIGCGTLELKKHLESKFTEGMSWDNYGQWHVDHIRPCASFDLSDPKQQQICFHYTNLQPLWAKDNLIKSNKFKE